MTTTSPSRSPDAGSWAIAIGEKTALTAQKKIGARSAILFIDDPPLTNRIEHPKWPEVRQAMTGAWRANSTYAILQCTTSACPFWRGNDAKLGDVVLLDYLRVTMIRRIKSAERTIALFELFARRQVGLTVGAVATGLRIPQPSASMLLRNLMSLGYLEYERHSKLYSPTIRVMFLGNWISQQFGAIRSVSQVLEEAQRRLDIEFVYVARQNGGSVQYVWTLEADPPNRLGIAPNVPRSLTCTAAGRALLSMKTDQEVIGWVRRSNAEAPIERLKVSERRFLNLYDRCRNQGFAETAGDFVPGLGALAVTLPTAQGSPLAISFGGAVERVHSNRGRILSVLKDVRDSLAGMPQPVPHATLPSGAS